jgi:hypothetical protein
MRDASSIRVTQMDSAFVRGQATFCFGLARHAPTPERRAYFLRLAWHWRGIGRVLAGREMPKGMLATGDRGELPSLERFAP